MLNTAAVLVTAGTASDLAAGVRLASEAIDTGAVKALVQALRST